MSPRADTASLTEEPSQPLRHQLVVLHGTAPLSRTLRSPERLVIGRAEDADVRLTDPSVSRHHAIIGHDDAGTTIADLKSFNGTRINGERIEEPRRLRSGDIVLVGAVPVLYHCLHDLGTERPLVDGTKLRARLAEEVERSLRYERPLTLVALPLAGKSLTLEAVSRVVVPRIRVTDAAAYDGETLWLLLIETDGDTAEVPAQRMVQALGELSPGIAAGYASCPGDALEVDGLMARASAAAAMAGEGQVAAAATAMAPLDIGGQRIVVADRAMVRVYELIRRLADSVLPVLVLGETGVGKELAATALHAWSSRAAQPLVAVNCAAIPDTLLESELFGHEKGAFTGATAAKPGRLEAADGGTLFLDEVADLSPPCQAKLLRVLETRRLVRLGGVRERAINVRIVAATNCELGAEVAAGRFRRDLYFRLSAATVYLPPLRERRRELPIVARALVEDACRRAGSTPKQLLPATLEILAALPWPGNVRELKNVVEYVVATVDGDVVAPEHLPIQPTATGAGTGARFPNIYDLVRELEIEWMERALVAAGGVQVRAAELIGMPLRTFVTKLKQYGLRDEHVAARARQ